MVAQADTLTGGALELIAFRIDDQEFCINVMSVREIRGWATATPIPHTPSYVLGIVNLRGAVLPIFDLSARLGMKPAEPTVRHVIIVAEIKGRIIGFLVEGVSDILTVTEDKIQPTPDISANQEKSYAKGILAIERRLICLIELETVFPHFESEAA